MPRNLIVALIFALSAIGCGGGHSVSDQPLQGRIGGESFVYVAGDTSAFLSDSEAFFASLYGEAFEACGFSQPSGNSLILSIPTTPGAYDLSLRRNMTFVVDGPDGIDNLIGTDGVIVVDEVTATSVSGGIYARYDGDNEIDGNFTVTICAE